MTVVAPDRAASIQRRLTDFKPFWDEERETLLPARRERLILERLQHQLAYVYERLPFYRRLYEQHGFHPSMIRNLEDFTTRVPIITKRMLVDDQAEHPPFGSYSGVEPKDIARVHGSTGTTGTPTLYSVSASDWKRAGESSAMGLWCAGFRPNDLVQITFPFTLFFGGWGNVQACELLGAAVFPSGTMIASERQLELMTRLGVSVIVATPSYLIHLANVAEGMRLDLPASTVSLALVGGEPGGSVSAVRDQITRGWGDFALVDGAAGSSSEMYPFLANIGCLAHCGRAGGVHVFQDENYLEIVSRDDPSVPVAPGTSGATVATHLWRNSQPMIRFWLGDEGVLDTEPCPCGRTYPRLPRGVFGRLDDMLIIRGANVYPSAIEAVIRSTPGAGHEFRVFVDRPRDLDEIRVEVERHPAAPATDEARAQKALERQFKARLGIRIPVTMVEPATFETQTFKARRVIDRRSKSQ